LGIEADGAFGVFEWPEEMTTVVGPGFHGEEFVGFAGVTAEEHVVGARDVAEDGVPDVHVHDVAGEEPNDDEDTKANVTGCFVFCVFEEFGNLFEELASGHIWGKEDQLEKLGQQHPSGTE
jgi:hypothetical protein